TCQVRSLENEWPALTLNRASSTVYDGKTMFSFVFDFSALGDPSELSTQANIACWAEGQDDAGFMLQASTGNSELDPWLVLPLNSIGPDVAITEVDVTGSTEAGGTMRIGVELVSLGEAIDEQFNVSIYAESNGERTLVGREVVASIGMNTATTLRSTITVPSGSWTLHVEADAEQTMWEVDETNNAWNRSFGPQTDGMSTSVVLLGGGLGVAVLAGAVVLLRRKQSDEPSFEEAPDEAGTTSAVKPTPAGLTGPPPRTSEPKPKPTGLKGPPPRSKPANEAAPAIDGAAALDALLPASTEEPQDHPVGSVVNEWSQLPPGGDYDYALDQTVYKGEECGTWRMNEDKTFTRIE
ncbi:LPXTG cell wall anchor domain-containing protein, partial [Candidatus Poseidoniaceae archaeon]|nr:LPXTG cell wall anchor domain-containing protein [Candidatus Poseidoniaceae archaeon]